MKLEKRIELCDSCGLGYYKPFYEPMWLSKILWKSSHGKYHQDWQQGHHASEVSEQWKQLGRQEEKERIINLLKQHDKETKAGSSDMAIKYRSAVLACIKLIQESR